MCNIAFQLVFQQCYETSSTVLPHFLQEHFCDLWCVYVGGGGGKEVLHKRQSSDLGTLEVESIGICSIEIGIARKKETSHNKSHGFSSILFTKTTTVQIYM